MDDETLETLKAIANEEHRTVSNLIGKFIQDALKEREAKGHHSSPSS